MKVTLYAKPSFIDGVVFKKAIWTTMGERGYPEYPSQELLHKCLVARHSPIRELRFVFCFEDIPSNTATHLCRHVHAQPYVSSLRNDRQEKIDGDLAPRNTPVDMMLSVNAEELMVIANKRLCMQAAQKTREVVAEMCRLAEEAFPAIRGCLVPMCEYHGGVCHEIKPCGRCKRDGMEEKE